MAINDLYEAAIRQELGGEEIYNIFHFQHLTSTGSAIDLATRIINQWITTNWQALVGLGVSFIEIAARNLFNPEDAGSVPVGLSGTVASEELPPHDALQVSLNTTSVITTGSKRFGGLTEASQLGGTWLAATQSGWNDFVFNQIASPLIGPAAELRYQTVVVKRIPYVTPGGSTAYRLPENSGEAVFAQVITGTVEPSVRTQRSRDFKE